MESLLRRHAAERAAQEERHMAERARLEAQLVEERERHEARLAAKDKLHAEERAAYREILSKFADAVLLHAKTMKTVVDTLLEQTDVPATNNSSKKKKPTNQAQPSD